MLKRNITYHISEDRIDRACYIMSTVGIGNIVKERPAYDEKGRLGYKCFTDTGVILILNQDKTLVVTLYIATQQQAVWIYNGKTPDWVFRTVKKNKVHLKKQNGGI